MKILIISSILFSLGLFAIIEMITIKAKLTLNNKVSMRVGLDYPYPKDCGIKRALKCRIG